MEYDSLQHANQHLLSLGLIRWPETQVFDQPMDGEKNTFDLSCRFEDSNSFSHVRIATEHLLYELKVDPSIGFAAPEKKTRTTLFVEFDRGVLGKVNMNTFRVDEWLKGFQHVLRRDIDKVLRKAR
jgi:hypothetical protein